MKKTLLKDNYYGQSLSRDKNNYSSWELGAIITLAKKILHVVFTDAERNTIFDFKPRNILCSYEGNLTIRDRIAPLVTEGYIFLFQSRAYGLHSKLNGRGYVQKNQQQLLWAGILFSLKRLFVDRREEFKIFIREFILKPDTNILQHIIQPDELVSFQNFVRRNFKYLYTKKFSQDNLSRLKKVGNN